MRSSLLLGIIVLWLAEIILVTHLNWSNNIVITVGLYPLVVITLSLLLEYPCSRYEQLAEKCHALADFTYYVHPLVIFVLQKVDKVIALDIEHTILFILTILFSVLILYIYYGIIKQPD